MAVLHFDISRLAYIWYASLENQNAPCHRKDSRCLKDARFRLTVLFPVLHHKTESRLVSQKNNCVLGMVYFVAVSLENQNAPCHRRNSHRLKDAWLRLTLS